MTDADPAEAAFETRAPRRSAPTIYDIARVAGVNPSTVSRALNKPGRVSARTERRVLDAARELGYRANPMARALPTGRTSTIGLIVADITNPMIFDVVRGAEHAASAEGFTLVLVESEESGDRELLVADRLMQSVDGIVLATSRLSDEAIGDLAARKPVVVVNRTVPGVPAVVADVDPGIAQAVRHLAGLGHRTVLYVAGPKASWMSEHRRRSIAERCAWSQMTMDTTEPGEPTVEGGRRAAARVVASGATAVVAFNDLMAIGLMQELAEAGVVVPRDVSIVGFDDIFGSDFTSPPLTTIRSPLREAGGMAVGMVLAELGASSTTTEREALRTHLVVRGSTGAV